MQTYIVLLRGINVGGHHILPMKAFVALLELNHFTQVSYYIQSGNLVLQSDTHPEEKIRRLIHENYSFLPALFVITKAEFLSAIDNNPYLSYEGKTVHFCFCKKPITLNIANIDHIKDPSESYQVHGNTFYLHAPNGIGRSKLVSKIDACLGQQTTSRNLNTVNKIKAMVENISLS